ncbi:Hypothetical protein CINCED_3A015352 [Cinara cedri]|uniref:Uncharacterized protein n=1 Tax=Cinara cedri TaxID=506608 RepID=A0A5E4MQF3_9HEMI|nr:Hypothetical protein CINCED_3A015352 [Cinara cedri]
MFRAALGPRHLLLPPSHYTAGQRRRFEPERVIARPGTADFRENSEIPFCQRTSSAPLLLSAAVYFSILLSTCSDVLLSQPRLLASCPRALPGWGNPPTFRTPRAVR